MAFIDGIIVDCVLWWHLPMAFVDGIHWWCHLQWCCHYFFHLWWHRHLLCWHQNARCIIKAYCIFEACCIGESMSIEVKTHENHYFIEPAECNNQQNWREGTNLSVEEWLIFFVLVQCCYSAHCQWRASWKWWEHHHLTMSLVAARIIVKSSKLATILPLYIIEIDIVRHCKPKTPLHYPYTQV